MKLALQLAYRNLVRSGLRTWLNVGVLAFAYLIILFYNGILDGWNQQAKRDSIAWEFGDGHFLNSNYDPLDPFTILDGHGIYPGIVSKHPQAQPDASENVSPGSGDKEKSGYRLIPILVRQASIYPEGRMLPVALKGIDTEQDRLELPTQLLKESSAEIPALLGQNMAQSAGLEEGDQVLIRWRDKNGTFDAANITIVKVFKTNVPMVDRGQIWIPIRKLWQMTGLDHHASMLVAAGKLGEEEIKAISNRTRVESKVVTGKTSKAIAGPQWTWLSQDDLLTDINEIIDVKKKSASIMYLLLLAIALLAIFDTQVLSVFRRQKEIGTYISLGMTRQQVVGLFTVEGSMYSIFAMIIGSAIGLPLLKWVSNIGIAFPVSADTGIAIAERIFPVFGVTLILSTILLVVVSATIVSYLPSRKIAKMNPVDALKGKLQ